MSDGPYRKYEIEGRPLEFIHRNNRSISNFSYKTILIIEALKYLGKEYIDETIIVKLAALLTDKEKEKLLIEPRTTSKWILNIVKKIVEVNDEN